MTTSHNSMTRAERDEILAKWDAAVAIGNARQNALMDTRVSVSEYSALARAESHLNDAAVRALGGYSRFSLPALTAWPDAR